MKLLTLNIQHGGGKRVPAILDYLDSQEADVVVLTEFRENAYAESLRAGMAAIGLRYFDAAATTSMVNSVGIFARWPFLSSEHPDLHAEDKRRLVTARFGAMVVHGVYFAQRQAKASLFDFLISGGHRRAAAPDFIVGDFNTGLLFLDERGATFHCAADFAALSESGYVDSWRSRHPDVGEFSWYSNKGNGFRVDHLLASPEADALIQHVYYDHTPREAKATDHSALVAEISAGV